MEKWLLLFCHILIFINLGAAETAHKIALYGDSVAANRQLDLLLAEYSSEHSFVFLERAAVRAILVEQKLAQSGLINRENIARAGNILHADVIALLQASSSDSLRLTAFDAHRGILLLVADYPEDVSTQTLAEALKNIVCRLEYAGDIRVATLFSIRNVELPAVDTPKCYEITERLMEKMSAGNPQIVFIASKHMGYANRELFLTRIRNNLLLSQALIYADFYRGRDDNAYRLILTVRTNGGSKREFTIEGDFRQPLPPDRMQEIAACILSAPVHPLLNPQREAQIYYDEYRLNSAKQLDTRLHRLPLYDTAVAYDSTAYLDKRYLKEIYFTAESLASWLPDGKPITPLMAERHIELLEYYALVYDEIVKGKRASDIFTPDDAAIFGAVSPQIVHYWNYRPGGWSEVTPKFTLSPELLSRAQIQYQRLYEIKKSQSHYDELISLKAKDINRSLLNLTGYPCFSEREYYERFFPLIAILIKYAERDGWIRLYDLWPRLEYHIRYAREQHSGYLPEWRQFAATFCNSSIPCLRLWGVMIKNELGEYTDRNAFQQAISSEVVKTLPSLPSGTPEYTRYHKTIEEVNALSSKILDAAVAQVERQKGNDDQSLVKQKITQDNYRKIEDRLKKIRTSPPRLSANAEEKFERNCTEVEHRLRRFKVASLHEPEADFPFETKVSQLWPLDSELRQLCDVAQYGDGPECWLFCVGTLPPWTYSIEKFNLESGQSERIVDFSKSLPGGNPLKLVASPEFVVLIPPYGNIAIVVDTAAQIVKRHQLPFNRVTAATILDRHLYAWFDQEQCLVDFSLPSMNWKMISSHASRDSETNQTAGMSDPHCYLAFADPKRNRVIFCFNTYRVANGPKRPGGFWNYTPTTGKLTWSGLEPHECAIFRQPLWLSPDMVTIGQGNAVYHWNLAIDQLTLSLWGASRDANETKSTLAWITKDCHIPVEKVLEYGVFNINEFQNKWHLPLGDWMWESAGGGTPFDVINLATGKIHYIDLPEIKRQDHVLYFRPAPNGSIYCFTAAGIYRISAIKKLLSR